MLSVQFDQPRGIGQESSQLSFVPTISPVPNAPTGSAFDHLVSRSLAVLAEALNDPELAPAERAAIAIEILKLAGDDAKQVAVSALTSPASPSSALQPLLLANATNLASSGTAIVPPEASFTTVLQPQLLVLENFLDPAANQEILDITFRHTADFVGSTTVTNTDNYRQSAILYATFFPDFYEKLRLKILKVLPTVLRSLNHRHFLVSQIEMQLTAHNDGCFYKVHNDSGSPDTETRELTYVYYFFREPKAFSGGEFAIYETDLTGSMMTPHENHRIFEPINNSIVFFDSRCKHEVQPVSCPSRQFEDSRFTLNGWLRRVD